MKCNNCKTDYLNAYDTIKSEGVKYKVYICPCCDKNIFVPVKKHNIK
jgi:RNase P subunit RPR2